MAATDPMDMDISYTDIPVTDNSSNMGPEEQQGSSNSINMGPSTAARGEQHQQQEGSGNRGNMGAATAERQHGSGNMGAATAEQQQQQHGSGKSIKMNNEHNKVTKSPSSTNFAFVENIGTINNSVGERNTERSNT